jgi:hypothetical protein
MTRNLALALAAAGVVVFWVPTAQADSYFELAHARANARAGGPVSARDAELLERYGCLSGTDNPVCKPRWRGKKKTRYHRRRNRH